MVEMAHMMRPRTSSGPAIRTLLRQADSHPADEFLGLLGERVREMRALCGLSRKQLAAKSGISERYVAQIEAGRGNVSIVLLLRIAYAIRCAQDAEGGVP
jgi:DNA-binding XRE family transcriptional regulator